MHKEQHNIGLNPYLKIQNYTIVSEDSNTQYNVLFCYGVPYLCSSTLYNAIGGLLLLQDG